MFTSKRYDLLRNPFPDRITFDPRAQPFGYHPSEKVWPIRRAVLFWAALSISGWMAIIGLANYLS